MIHVTAKVHHHACTDDTVTIGRLARVWQFASVVRHAVLGDEVSLASCAIADGCSIGDRTRVSHGAFIDPGVRIGQDCFIGPHVSLCNDPWPRTDRTGWYDIASLMPGGIVVIDIMDGASIGAGAIVLPGVRIGLRAMVAANAVVTGDVPDDCVRRRDGSTTLIDPLRVMNRRRECCM